MGTKIIREYFSCDSKEQTHWLEEIGKSDWRAGQVLYSRIKENKLRIPGYIGENSHLYLVTEDDELCGFCTLAEKDDIRDTDLSPWVGFVYTFPKYRGQRLFGSLLAKAIEQARSEGYGSVYINTDHTDLYERYGACFQEISRNLSGEDTRIYRLDFDWMAADPEEQGIPFREKAERLLEASCLLNPGPWREHSYGVGRAAENIARACGDIDPERAYICGLLHDIGRRFGKGHLRHVYDGWQFLERLKFPVPARVCLTHSFKLQKLDDYVGNHDLTPEEEAETISALSACQYDDIDSLIQLCDSICGVEIMKIEDRMSDVKRRYGGYYPQDKWDASIDLLHSFERRAGGNIYRIAEGGL